MEVEEGHQLIAVDIYLLCFVVVSVVVHACWHSRIEISNEDDIVLIFYFSIVC